MKCKKVLIITYYFPPVAYAGALRVTKFIKYLPDFGWCPSVLTSKGYSHIEYDHSLLKDIPKFVKVFKVQTLEHDTLFYLLKKKRYDIIKNESRLFSVLKLLNFFLIPDTKVLWFFPALLTGTKILSKGKFDLIFSTAPPLTDHLVAISLKSKYRIPVVVDYRDAWYEDPYRIFPTDLHRKLIKLMEKFIAKRADAGVSVFDGIVQNRIMLGLKRGYTIEHGYDPDDFSHTYGKIPHNDKLTITYAGTLSYDADPTPLFEALRDLKVRYPDIARRIVLNIFSTPQARYMAEVKEMGITDIVRWKGFIPHKDIIPKLVDSDVLLVLIDRKATHPYVSQSKIFEYIGAGKPILGILPEGTEAWRILNSLGNSFCVTPDSVDNIVKILIHIYRYWKYGRLKPIPESVRRKYNRREQAKKLAEIFNEVTS